MRLALFSDGQRTEFQKSQAVTGLGGLSFGAGFCLFQLVGKESHWKLIVLTTYSTQLSLKIKWLKILSIS